MWYLLIVLFLAPPDVDRITVLKSFATYEDCQPEGDRVGLELAENYPDDDFRIICAFRAPHSYARYDRGIAFQSYCEAASIWTNRLT